MCIRDRCKHATRQDETLSWSRVSDGTQMGLKWRQQDVDMSIIMTSRTGIVLARAIHANRMISPSRNATTSNHTGRRRRRVSRVLSIVAGGIYTRARVFAYVFAKQVYVRGNHFSCVIMMYVRYRTSIFTLQQRKTAAWLCRVCTYMFGLLSKATNVPCQGCETLTDMAAESATIQHTRTLQTHSKLRPKNDRSFRLLT